MCSSKIYLILLNVLFVILSLIIITIGTIIQLSFYGSSGLLHNYISLPACLTIAFGVILLTMSLAVIVSVHYKKITLLYTYIFLLIALVTLELSIGIASFLMKSYLLDMVTNSLQSAQPKYMETDSVSLVWNSIQQDLKCCGVNQYDEWFKYLGNSSVPDSCCVEYSPNCGSLAVQNDNIIKTGCSKALHFWIKRHEITIIVLFVVFLVLQVLAVLLTLCHSKTLVEYNTLN